MFKETFCHLELSTHYMQLFRLETKKDHLHASTNKFKHLSTDISEVYENCIRRFLVLKNRSPNSCNFRIKFLAILELKTAM